jgi:hypothetical protein
MSSEQWATVLGSIGWAVLGLVLDEIIRFSIRLKHKEFRDPKPLTMLGIVVLLISIASAVFAMQASLRTSQNTDSLKRYSTEVRDFAQCLQGVQQKNIDALNNIRSATQAQDDAISLLINSIADSIGTPEAQAIFRQNLTLYQATTQQLKQERLDNPYTDPRFECVAPHPPPD